jgi:Mg2+-importing ATPase
MDLPTTTMSPAQRQGNLAGGKEALVSDQLLEKARSDTETVLRELESRPDGLSQAEADSRLKQYGLNEIAREKRQSALMRLLSNVKNPLVLLLTALGVLSFLTGDLRATAVIFVMVVLGVVLRFFQEMRADNAAEKLKAMVSNTATLVRDGKEAEVPLKMLVPGDIIRLAAGDMVPADVRVLSAKDLFLSGGTHRRILARREKSRRGVRRRSEPAGTAQYLLPGLQRGERLRDGCGRPHRRQDLLWIAGCQYRRAASADQLR